MGASTTAIDELTERERLFVKHYSSGMTKAQAAAAAGYKQAKDSGQQLVAKPRVQRALQQAREYFQAQINISRKDVADGFISAINDAKVLGDPVAQIAGWDKMAKLLGYYEPQKKEISINVTGQMEVKRLEQLPDEELMKLINVIDVEPEGEDEEESDDPSDD